MPAYEACSIVADNVLYSLPRDFTQQKSVSSGSVTFYLTDDGTALGNAMFREVFLTTMQVTVPDATGLFQAGAGTLSGDKKTLTVPIKKFDIGTSVVTVLGISVIGSITPGMINAPNGTLANLMIEGVI